MRQYTSRCSSGSPVAPAMPEWCAPAGGGALCRSGCPVRDSDPEHRRLREILQRPRDRGVRAGDQGRRAMPNSLTVRKGFPPFPPDYRASGVLLHVTSLPSPYGIGDVGPAAVAWIDRLHAADQSVWQGLPLGPTGYGNSPYQALSSFAGNGLLISPDWLIEDGLLKAFDCASP